jgi:hypothetical protein
LLFDKRSKHAFGVRSNWASKAMAGRSIIGSSSALNVTLTTLFMVGLRPCSIKPCGLSKFSDNIYPLKFIVFVMDSYTLIGITRISLSICYQLPIYGVLTNSILLIGCNLMNRYEVHRYVLFI